ncbi:MAG: hypothetical protein WC824_11980 [Bacteroidota bacterium]
MKFPFFILPIWFPNSDLESNAPLIFPRPLYSNFNQCPNGFFLGTETIGTERVVIPLVVDSKGYMIPGYPVNENGPPIHSTGFAGIHGGFVKSFVFPQVG